MSTTTPPDTRAARYRHGVAELGRLQKTAKGAPAYSRWVNRWMGRRLAAAAAVAGLTPNAVTGLSALATFAGIALLALAEPTPVVSVLIGLLLVLGYALDAADGQLARLQGSGSAAGEWLDHAVDAVKTSVLHLAVLVSWFRFTDLDTAWLLVPLGYQVVASVFFFTMILTDQLRRSLRKQQGMFMAADGTSSTAYSLAVLPTDYGLLCLVLGLVAWPAVFVPAYGLLFVANAGFVALALPKWYREIRRLAEHRPEASPAAHPAAPRR
jgi:phosphatidylglycerophosphate synthase